MWEYKEESWDNVQAYYLFRGTYVNNRNVLDAKLKRCLIWRYLQTVFKTAEGDPSFDIIIYIFRSTDLNQIVWTHIPTLAPGYATLDKLLKLSW